jgi:hypothetical protein
MMVTMLQSTNQVETFSGMRAVMSTPVGRRDVHGQTLADDPEEIEAFAGPVQRVISEAIAQDADSSRPD